MSKVTVNINSYRGISSRIDGEKAGRLYVDRSPCLNPNTGMGFDGVEMLCVALGACFFNSLLRKAKEKKIVIKSVEVEIVAEMDEHPSGAQQFVLSPKIESRVDDSVLKELLDIALQDSLVASTLENNVSVCLAFDEKVEII